MCPQGRTASASPASKSSARESLHSISAHHFSENSQGQLDSEVDRQAAERQHTQLSPPLSAATRQLPAGPRHSNRAFPPDRAPSMRKRRRSCQLQKHSNTMPVCSRVYEARVLLDRPWLLKSHQECGVALAVSRTSPFPVHLRLALGGCVQTGRAGPITLVQGFGLFWPFFGPRVSSLAVFATVPGSHDPTALSQLTKGRSRKKSREGGAAQVVPAL